ncbi:putative lipoate--protein ligase [Saccharomyces eubayanus]|uniref:putative lipoate--protein ligase n=1 Tax=Saccharomyces eubayanus TaxID=1080349 RepID=UPI0006C18751|nr:AIM22-like protein [Saccharomyces eubayanus]KOG98559.1 AIM22-like protein [Saccharomyces eubayanus]
MSIILRNLGLSPHYMGQRSLVCCTTLFHTFTKLEKDTDDKYHDINSMYQNMFTPMYNHSPMTQRESEGAIKANTSLEDDINDFNKDMHDLYNIGFSKETLSASQLKDIVKAKGRFVLQSLSTNPYYNLALENYMFTNTPKTKKGFDSCRLLFYINNKCAVIGKNQNLWQEVDLAQLKSKNFELLRRFSGGGTVLHDLGNVNYSFLTSRDKFDTKFFNKKVIGWLNSSDPELKLELNDRGDIVQNGFKVSGSAYKIAGGKAYHHATMLLNANLEQFSGLLEPSFPSNMEWESSGVQSVKSKIKNVGTISPGQFIGLVSERFQKSFKVDKNIPIYACDESTTINDEIKDAMKSLQSDNWKYFSGPKFSIKLKDKNLKIQVVKGMVYECNRKKLIGLEFNDFLENIDSYT